MRILVVVLTLMAMLSLPFAGEANHALELHAAVQFDDHGHSHDIDDDMASDDGEHHRADHTHEKVAVLQVLRERIVMSMRQHFPPHLDEIPQDRLYGIDRPPRTLSLA